MKALRVRVLLIDDFEPWRRRIRSILLENHYDLVWEASDGSEGVQKAKELQPDLVLIDIGLPTLNGIEAARQISELVPKSKILFVSLQRDEDLVQRAMLNGGAGYVIKTSVNRDLLVAVEAVLQGQRFLSTDL